MQTFKLIVAKRRMAPAAFTLIEVLIASTIAAIIFAALFYTLNQGTTLVQVSREDLRATQILNGKIELIRNCAWGSGSGTNTVATQLFDRSIIPTNFTDYFYPSALGGFSTNSVRYTGTIMVETNFAFRTVGTNGTTSVTIPPTYSNSIARVTVTLTWTEKHYGQPITFYRTNITYISANGLQNYLSSH